MLYGPDSSGGCKEPSKPIWLDQVSTTMRASSGGDGGRGGGRPQRVRQRTNPEKQIRVVVIRSNSGSGKVRRSPTSETGACF